ncbi:hypothetical protein GPALN_006113 [Globodera pallida]|nr:hypothetical protein GPALN_006113 [Globodera pallida]
MKYSEKAGGTKMKPKISKRRQQTLDKMSITKSTDRTPNLDKLNPIQLIKILISQSLITLIMPKMGKNLLLKMSENVKLLPNSTQ